MYLRNWEHNATTGLPISGATVEVRAASLVSPNTGTVIASTTTDTNGMWEFPALPDAAADVKITYSGNVWWHKGMTKHSVDAIFYVTPTPRTDQFLRNGGFEKGSTNGPWTVTNVQQTVLDSWQAANGVGSSAIITRDLTVHAPDSDASAKIVQTRVSGSLNLFEQMSIPSVFRGKTVSLSFQVRQGVANSVQAYIYDGTTTTTSATSATTGSFVTLTVTATIGASATSVQFGVLVNVSDTVYIDDGIANLGSVPSTYQPEYWFPGAASDDIIGLRNPDQTIAAQSGSYNLGTLVSMFANRIKVITGTTNWYDVPATTLAGIVTSLVGKVSKTGDTMTGTLTLPGTLAFNNTGGAAGVQPRVTGVNNVLFLVVDPNASGNGEVQIWTGPVGGSALARLVVSGTGNVNATVGMTIQGNGVWHAGNFDPATTLIGFANNLGGQPGSYYLNRANHTNTQTASTISDLSTAVASLTANNSSLLIGVAGSNFARKDVLQNFSVAPTIAGANIWTSSNHGPGSGLNADLLDGLDSTAFVKLSPGAIQTITLSGVSNQLRFGRNADTWDVNLTGNMQVQGNFTSTGVKSASVLGPDGKTHLFHATEAPRAYFEDYGSGHIELGHAYIEIPTDFKFYVDTEQDYYITLTPYGQGSLWVESKSADAFIVGGSEDVRFDWRITALRKDVSLPRLATAEDLV